MHNDKNDYEIKSYHLSKKYLEDHRELIEKLYNSGFMRDINTCNIHDDDRNGADTYNEYIEFITNPNNIKRLNTSSQILNNINNLVKAYEEYEESNMLLYKFNKTSIYSPSSKSELEKIYDMKLYEVIKNINNVYDSNN